MKIELLTKDLAAIGVEAKTIRYSDDQCSCCFFPEFTQDKNRISIPLNKAPNQMSYVEQFIEDDRYIIDQFENPEWEPGINDLFYNCGTVKTDTIVFIGHELDDDKFDLVKDIFDKYYDTEWDKTNLSSICITC